MGTGVPAASVARTVNVWFWPAGIGGTVLGLRMWVIVCAGESNVTVPGPLIWVLVL